MWRIVDAISSYLQVAKMSIQTGVVSEYTRMALLENERGKKAMEAPGAHEVYIDLEYCKHTAAFFYLNLAGKSL